MTEDNRTYIAIDLKSFFASVECAERGLDPLTTNLVVANVRNIWNPSTGSYNGFYRRNNKKKKSASITRLIQGMSCFLKQGRPMNWK